MWYGKFNCPIILWSFILNSVFILPVAKCYRKPKFCNVNLLREGYYVTLMKLLRTLFNRIIFLTWYLNTKLVNKIPQIYLQRCFIAHKKRKHAYQIQCLKKSNISHEYTTLELKQLGNLNDSINFRINITFNGAF